jgi:hypothetical protein
VYTVLSTNFNRRNHAEVVGGRFNIKPDVREILCPHLDWIQMAQKTMMLMSRKFWILWRLEFSQSAEKSIKFIFMSQCILIHGL